MHELHVHVLLATSLFGKYLYFITAFEIYITDFIPINDDG